jgi:hypothetical protein
MENCWSKGGCAESGRGDPPGRSTTGGGRREACPDGGGRETGTCGETSSGTRSSDEGATVAEGSVHSYSIAAMHTLDDIDSGLEDHPRGNRGIATSRTPGRAEVFSASISLHPRHSHGFAFEFSRAREPLAFRTAEAREMLLGNRFFHILHENRILFYDLIANN